MPAGPFGLTFAPTADAAAEAAKSPEMRHGGEQSAVQIVSLGLPRVVGSRAPAAAALMQPGVGGGGPDRAVLQSVLRAMLGGDVELPGAPSAPDLGDRAESGGGVSGAEASRANPFGAQIADSVRALSSHATSLRPQVPYIEFGNRPEGGISPATPDIGPAPVGDGAQPTLPAPGGYVPGPFDDRSLGRLV